MDSAAVWAACVEHHFGFLSSFGFRLEGLVSSAWEDRATFLSGDIGVAVVRSREFVRVEVHLMRLVEGRPPPVAAWVVDDVPIDTFLLDDLVALRLPEVAEAAARLHGLADEEVEAQLAFWADALRRCATDVLAGDARPLDAVEHVVRDRARATPQTLHVWVSEGTDPDAARAEVERLRQDTPPGVDVSLRWYRRGGP